LTTVCTECTDPYARAGGQQPADEIRRIQALATAYVFGDGPGRDDVHSHADTVLQAGLLRVAREMAFAVGFQHSEIDVDRPAVGADRDRIPNLVRGIRLGHVHVGQRVAVDHQHA